MKSIPSWSQYGGHSEKRSSLFDQKRGSSARVEGRKLAQTYRLWFRKQYNLAPTDPRYLAATDEQIETEWWAYQYQAGKVQEEFLDEQFSVEDELARIEQEAAERDRAAPPDDWEDIDG